jgi:hypothetical protein
MEEFVKREFKSNIKDYNYLKENSNFFKELNRGVLDYKTFSNNMKKIHQERLSDKLDKTIDNMELVSSLLSILK